MQEMKGGWPSERGTARRGGLEGETLEFRFSLLCTKAGAGALAHQSQDPWLCWGGGGMAAEAAATSWQPRRPSRGQEGGEEGWSQGAWRRVPGNQVLVDLSLRLL